MDIPGVWSHEHSWDGYGWMDVQSQLSNSSVAMIPIFHWIYPIVHILGGAVDGNHGNEPTIAWDN